MTLLGRRIIVVGLAAALLGAGAAAICFSGLGGLVDQARERLGTVLLVGDLLVEPGEEVTLSASLRHGLRLEGVAGRRVQFVLGDTLLAEVRTDKNGDAAVQWKTPDKAGDSVVRVRLNAGDQPSTAVEDAELRVAARPKETKFAVVDLDKTLVASGFIHVLSGDAQPMPGAAAVLQRLARDQTIVYLTQRPDFLGAASKRWLLSNGFPPGPVLTSTAGLRPGEAGLRPGGAGTLMIGSGPYKHTRLAEMKRTFPNLVVGIGDKFSDAKVYAASGLRPILILHVDWSEDEPEDYEKLAANLAALPDSVQAVTNWSQIASILFEGAAFPKKDMEKRLIQVARDLRERGKD